MGVFPSTDIIEDSRVKSSTMRPPSAAFGADSFPVPVEAAAAVVSVDAEAEAVDGSAFAEAVLLVVAVLASPVLVFFMRRAINGLFESLISLILTFPS